MTSAYTQLARCHFLDSAAHVLRSDSLSSASVADQQQIGRDHVYWLLTVSEEIEAFLNVTLGYVRLQCPSGSNSSRCTMAPFRCVEHGRLLLGHQSSKFCAHIRTRFDLTKDPLSRFRAREHGHPIGTSVVSAMGLPIPLSD